MATNPVNYSECLTQSTARRRVPASSVIKSNLTSWRVTCTRSPPMPDVVVRHGTRVRRVGCTELDWNGSLDFEFAGPYLVSIRAFRAHGQVIPSLFATTQQRTIL